MYDQVIEVLLDSFVNPGPDQRANQDALTLVDLLAVRICDAAHIKLNYPVFGGFAVSDLTRLINNIFPGQSELAQNVAQFIYDRIEVVPAETFTS